MEQLERYMKAKSKGVGYVSFVLVDKTKEALPKEDLFPELRNQMATFDGQTQTSSF